MACDIYRTGGRRLENNSPDFHWEHSGESIRFIPWYTPPPDDARTSVMMHRHESDDERSWGLDVEYLTPDHCYVCEIDLLGE